MPELAQSAGFILYPRGFFGAVMSPSIKKQPKPFSGSVNRLQPNVNLFHNQRSGDSIMINENVEMLYAQLISREDTIDNFEFREKILKTALAAFGTPMFDFWYSQQKYSPSAGDLHREFLEDTLLFIETGTRSQHLETWNVLVTFSDKGDRENVLTERAAEFFGITSQGIRREPRHSSLIDVLCAWTAQPGGFMDLLFTLHILFGVQ